MQSGEGGGIYCGGKSRLIFHKRALSSVLHKEITGLSLKQAEGFSRVCH